jgi:hypothetical protein
MLTRDAIRAGRCRQGGEHITQTQADHQTSHESVPDVAHVGRFSTGLEARPQTAAKLHRGRFSEGLERLPQTPRKRRPGRFSDGLEALSETPAKTRRGSFADGAPATPVRYEPGDRPARRRRVTR